LKTWFCVKGYHTAFTRLLSQQKLWCYGAIHFAIRIHSLRLRLRIGALSITLPWLTMKPAQICDHVT